MHLLTRNQRHLEQTAREGGISAKPPLTTIWHYRLNPLTDKILDGTFTTTYDLSSEMKAFFDALQSTSATESLPQVLGAINSEQFLEMFHCSKEKTSSDLSTLLDNLLCKCIATSNRIAYSLCTMASSTNTGPTYLTLCLKRNWVRDTSTNSVS